VNAPGPAAQEAAGPLRWLADAYARYAHLILAQIHALEEGDVARVEALAAERSELAAEIDGADAARVSEMPGTERLLAAVRQALARAAEADARLRARLGELRTETREAIGQTDHAAERIATLARSYAKPSPVGARLDRSF
jgi:chromosome segregation ATPase